MNSKIALSIENHSWPNGYFTEKLIEPLIYGSIPLYIGSPFMYNLKEAYNEIDKILINQSNVSKTIESIMHFKHIPINECKMISKKMRESIDKLVLECEKINLNVLGLMCLPPLNELVDKYFSLIKNKNDEFKFKDLSLGMSNDYIEALNYKTSFIRIGTKIFGERF